MSILLEYINKSCKVLTQEKQRIRNSSTTISTGSLSNNYFKLFTSLPLNCSFKINKIYLNPIQDGGGIQKGITLPVFPL